MVSAADTLASPAALHSIKTFNNSFESPGHPSIPSLSETAMQPAQEQDASWPTTNQ